MKPQRIQLRRTKGWRMPPNTVKVDRSTKWGNPFRVGEMWTRRRIEPGGGEKSCGPITDPAEAVRLFKRFTARETVFQIEVAQSLRGKNLACWCRLCDQHRDGKPLGADCSECAPCHADVLLGLANDECTNSSTD